jgi:hypothetical protein
MVPVDVVAAQEDFSKYSYDASGSFHKATAELSVLDEPSISAQQVTDLLEKERGVRLANTRVEGNLDLCDSDFDYLIANNTVFAGDVTIRGKGVGLFSNVCNSESTKPDLRLYDCEVLGHVDVYGVTFENLMFVDTRFRQPVWLNQTGVEQFLLMEKSILDEDANFANLYAPLFMLAESIFHGDVNLTGTKGKTLSFRDVNFKGSANLADASWNKFFPILMQADAPIYIRWSQLEIVSGRLWVE